MNYHKPTLRKLIKEPKGFDKLLALPKGEHVWYSDGHWALKLHPDDMPIELRGFLPTANEPEGYVITGHNPNDRQETQASIDAVMPKNTQPATLTRWVCKGEFTTPDARMVVFKGKPVFFDVKILDPLLALCPDPQYRMADPCGALVIVGMDEEPLAMVMPIRVDEETTPYVQGMAVARKHKKED